MAPAERRFDFVIVGSGAGGAVLAKELAAGGASVCIVEEGSYWKPKTHTDLPSRAVRRLYRYSGFTSAFGKPFIPVPLGKGVGGTTLINSGTCFRTPDAVLKKWTEEFRLPLSRDEMEPYFARVEKELGVAAAEPSVCSRPNLLVAESLKKRNLHQAPLLRNAPGCEGCGSCCYGCPTGAKKSTDVSYVPKALQAGAALVSDCRVTKILKKGKKVTGVSGVNPATGEKITITAKETILACGSLLTPCLLQKNRIASGNPHVGKHLTIHPASKVMALFEETQPPWKGIPQAFFSTALKEDGILLEGAVLPPDLVALSVPFWGEELLWFMRNYPKMASFGFMISDTNQGRVDHWPLWGPQVQYSLGGKDMDRVVRANAFLAELFFEAGAREVLTLLPGFTRMRSREEIKRLEAHSFSPHDFNGMGFHPLSSCRMAVAEDEGVVDSAHKVFGWEGLRICDGSVVPSSPGVNPQITIMSLATRLARLMLEI